MEAGVGTAECVRIVDRRPVPDRDQDILETVPVGDVVVDVNSIGDAPDRVAYHDLLSGWLDERAVVLASYGGLVRGGIKMLPIGVRALRHGKASLKPHHKRPGAAEIKRIFDRYYHATAQRRKEN